MHRILLVEMRMEEKEKIGSLVKEWLFTLSFVLFLSQNVKSLALGDCALCVNDAAEQQSCSPVFKEVLDMYLFLCHGSFNSCWNDFTCPLS